MRRWRMTTKPISHEGQDVSAGLPRRAVLASLGVGAAAFTGLGAALAQDRPWRRNESPLPDEPRVSPKDMGWDPDAGRYVLPPLPYPADALEPHIDGRTMELHHGQHHQGYVNGLNKALERLEEIRA